MGTIVIHAGIAKAGSSAVQHWLATNVERLRREHGVTLAVAVAADPIRVEEFNGRGSINSHALGLARRDEGVWGRSLERFFADLDALFERR